MFRKSYGHVGTHMSALPARDIRDGTTRQQEHSRRASPPQGYHLRGDRILNVGLVRNGIPPAQRLESRRPQGSSLGVEMALRSGAANPHRPRGRSPIDRTP